MHRSCMLRGSCGSCFFFGEIITRLCSDQRTADTLLRAEQQRAYEETMERDRQVQLERDAEQQRQVDEAEQVCFALLSLCMTFILLAFF